MSLPGAAGPANAVSDPVEAWCREDHARALLPIDHDVVEATHALRSLIVEGILGEIDTRDLLHACWRLGHTIAISGGSPTLLGSTLDGAESATKRKPCAWVAMRAAACEGFAAARSDLARAETMAGWEYPSCVVWIDHETVAVACGFPDEDEDAVAAWAGRVAQLTARAGARRAVVSGRDMAVRALLDAFALVGIEPIPELRERRSWLPWKRTRTVR